MKLSEVPGYLASKLTFHLMSIQSMTGFPFDKEGAESLVIHIKEKMKEIEDEVEPKLPPRKLKKSEEKDYTFPAKPFKKDGTLSSHGQAFLDKHNLTLIGLDHVQWEGELTKIVGGKLLEATKPMTLGNQDDIKDWLLTECGWSPTIFNYKKDEKGKPVRDKNGNPVTTSPKMQEGGRLCPNLERLQGDMVRGVVKWLSYRNRLSVIEGWLENDRIKKESVVSASSSGIAATHRQRHSVVCNLPKADPTVLLGNEVRSLFVARPGNVLVGYDASALEARVEAHYCYKFEGGEAYAYDLLEGDIHMKTTEIVFGDKISDLLGTPDFHKDHERVKPWRSKSKTVRYSTAYGCSPSKLAKTLNVSEEEGRIVYDKFWEAAVPLAALKEALITFWETTGEKKWIRGIDGRKLYSRSKHSLVNLLFQSCGAIAMDYSSLLMDKWLGGIQYNPIDGTPGYLYKGCWVYRVAYMHDEYVYDCHPDIAQDVADLGVKSIRKAGEYLKLRVPLDGEAKIGDSWQAIH
jgi:hypothetical protein